MHLWRVRKYASRYVAYLVLSLSQLMNNQACGHPFRSHFCTSLLECKVYSCLVQPIV